MPDPRPTPRESTSADNARIAAEIVGLDPGTNPFVAAVRATRMPMIITDPKLPDNPVAFANDAFCRLTGYAREEILGRNCRFLQGADTDPDTVRRLHDAVVSRQPVQVDILNYRKTGESFWNRLLLAPVRDADGELAYFFASQVDVTLERERLEGLQTQNAALTVEIGERLRALSDSEERLKLATQAGEIGVWELDLASGVLTTSGLCRENFGRDPVEPFPYEALRDAVHPDDQARMQAAVRHSIETGQDYRIEYRVVVPDGGTAWVQIHARVQRGRDGSPVRMVGTSRDVSAMKNAEQQTQVLLDLDRNVFSALDDPDQVAYLAAQALGRLFNVSRAGYGTINKRDETISIERDWNAPGIRSIAGTLHFRDYGSYIEDLSRGVSVVIDDATADPRTAPTADALIAISARSFVNMPVHESGDLVALLYLNHDQTRRWSAEELAFIREIASRIRQTVERRRAEQDLRALAASLEAQVQERSAQLVSAEAALRQAQKMEAVGQLTGGLAHDFNNLLAAISGSLEVLHRKKPEASSAEFERMVQMGRNATRKAAALTHRLLAFSRQQALEPRHLNLNHLVQGIEDLVRRTIGPDVVLDVVAADGLWQVLVDPGQLENSLLNLCINARDAMPGGGRLTIETCNHWIDEATAGQENVAPGPYVSLCVTDTGVGMPASVAARAFDPFFTTKPIGAGTGLGLSMVYGFCKQSNGYARIQTQEGRGTTVGIYLPRREGEEALPAVEAAEAAHASSGGGRTVMVVDDEDDLRGLVASTLRDAGYRVVDAADGLRATDLLQALKQVDLLVTDVGLPGGMNGRQLADAARKMRPNLPVLFITGYADHAVLGDWQLGQGVHILTKPFELAELAAKVMSVLDANRPAA